MTVWKNPKKSESSNVWVNPKKAQQQNMGVQNKKNSPFPLQGFGLGLAQGLENYVKGLTSHGAEPEVDIPAFLRHEKLQNKPEVNRSPSFNFEQYLDPSQNIQFKVGEYAPEILAAGALGKAAIKGLSKVGSKSIGKGIVKDVKDLKKSFKQEYNDIFNQAEKRGVKNIKSTVPKEQLESILSNVDKKYYSGLENFIENPTAINAHFAQSDLGKLIRRLEGKKELVTAEHEALKNARQAQKTLKKEVYDALLKEGGLDLPFKYSDVTSKYAKNLVPYLENTAVRKASLKPGQKGYIDPKRLPHKLKLESGDPLMAHLRGKIEGSNTPINPSLFGKHPLLGINQMLTSPLIKYGIGGTGLGYGGYEMWKKLLGNG